MRKLTSSATALSYGRSSLKRPHRGAPCVTFRYSSVTSTATPCTSYYCVSTTATLYKKAVMAAGNWHITLLRACGEKTCAAEALADGACMFLSTFISLSITHKCLRMSQPHACFPSGCVRTKVRSNQLVRQYGPHVHGIRLHTNAAVIVCDAAGCLVQVPEECPQVIADLVDTCLSESPAARPTAQEIYDIISGTL